MKGFFLTIVVIAALIGVVHLLNPLLLVKAWYQYKAPIGSEKFCQKYDVLDCPANCYVIPNSLIDEKDLGCHAINSPSKK